VNGTRIIRQRRSFDELPKLKRVASKPAASLWRDYSLLVAIAALVLSLITYTRDRMDVSDALPP
jgi:hypothetical protein